MELRRYAALIWKWAWLLVLGTVVGGGVAFAFLRNQPKVYEASASVSVSQATSGAVITSTDILNSQVLARAYSQIATSADVLNQVAANLGISYADDRTTVAASAIADSQLIMITVSSRSPFVAANVANETTKVFAARLRNRQLEQSASFEEELKSQINDIQGQISTLQREILRLNGRPADLPEDQRLQQLYDKQVQLDSLREYLRTLQLRLFDLRSQVARSLTQILPVNIAVPPSAPVRPHVRRDTVLGAFLGLLIAAGLAALREYLDDTVKSAEDVEKAAPGIATLGAVTHFQPTEGETGRLLVNQRPHSPVTEAYRVIRTNLEFAQSGHSDRRVLLITSASPQEGKSTTAANLAQILAQTGAQVVLVDADLRRPTVHKLFEVPNSSGLSTLFVLKTVEVEPLLRPTAVENLRVLPSGPIPPNPTELVASPRMNVILDALKEVADIIVVDSPPMLGVADASVLATRVDGVVVVVDSSRTRVGALKHTVELLQRGHATIWGVVLNKLRALEGDQYYYYYSSYRTYAGPDAGPPPANGKAGGNEARGPLKLGRNGQRGRREKA